MEKDQKIKRQIRNDKKDIYLDLLFVNDFKLVQRLVQYNEAEESLEVEDNIDVNLFFVTVTSLVNPITRGKKAKFLFNLTTNFNDFLIEEDYQLKLNWAIEGTINRPVSGNDFAGYGGNLPNSQLVGPGINPPQVIFTKDVKTVTVEIETIENAANQTVDRFFNFVFDRNQVDSLLPGNSAITFSPFNQEIGGQLSKVNSAITDVQFTFRQATYNEISEILQVTLGLETVSGEAVNINNAISFDTSQSSIFSAYVRTETFDGGFIGTTVNFNQVQNGNIAINNDEITWEATLTDIGNIAFAQITNLMFLPSAFSNLNNFVLLSDGSTGDDENNSPVLNLLPYELIDNGNNSFAIFSS